MNDSILCPCCGNEYLTETTDKRLLCTSCNYEESLALRASMYNEPDDQADKVNIQKLFGKEKPPPRQKHKSVSMKHTKITKQTENGLSIWV